MNNAGAMAIAPLVRFKVDEWERMIDSNVKGVLYGVAAALAHMQKQKSGNFINIASVFGIKVFATGGPVYCATEEPVRTLTEGLRVETHADKTRCTIISPAAVDSELKQRTSDKASAKAVNELYETWAIPAESDARAVAFAIEQPADVDINDNVIPTALDF